MHRSFLTNTASHWNGTPPLLEISQLRCELLIEWRSNLLGGR
jgi:hypothetical protein